MDPKVVWPTQCTVKGRFLCSLCREYLSGPSPSLEPCVDSQSPDKRRGEVRPRPLVAFLSEAFALHLFARCRSVASRTPCGSQPADRCASETVPQERRRDPPGSPGQRVGAQPPPGVWPRAGSCQGSGCASGTVPSSSRRDLRRQSPQVGELLLLRGSNPNPLYHQR